LCLADLVENARTLKVGAGLEVGTDVSPVISKVAKERVLGLINKGIEEGATLLLDGRNVSVPGYESGNFVCPTILSDVTTEMSAYKEEIFGQVLIVLTAPDLDEAIRLVNRNPFGNGVRLFAQSGAAARRFQSEIDAGQVGINIPIPVPFPVRYFSFTALVERSWVPLDHTESRSCSSIRKQRRLPLQNSPLSQLRRLYPPPGPRHAAASPIWPVPSWRSLKLFLGGQRRPIVRQRIRLASLHWIPKNARFRSLRTIFRLGTVFAVILARKRSHRHGTT
jgi:hypothetical protein